ncbi:hypothetical protein SGFS_096790 [Streptomyces graminofaciens]|uniref:non-specific serine/threonine protein kinase n=1 Tax=Streptomyces graminofaciens TaxID=68212 RepID=A0ABM7FNI5_9ACTN|nr:serine/threonine-protein kinase [Streptomyces graminofaciens]BBC38385.1 hypothetical protein SGFS_096790 [Streptomyces graminofaciens]
MAERMLDGRYRLFGTIGDGGMGEVWRAHDEHLHRDVAVKLVKGLGHGDDPGITARFVREARAVARLSSPHIVTVYELGTASEDDGPAFPYLVMELIDGRRLDRIVRGASGPLALDDVAHWGGQMCKALDTAHTAGVVHRDMKPANVLVTGADPADREDSLVKVLDFGIARLLDSAGAPTALTTTGSVVGTPAYMSPEQAHGDVPVDERTDLYSLGCILYELVTGRLPFEASAWHVLLRKHMDEPPVPPSRHRPELPHDWDELILALLEKKPADRPQRAAEVRRRLGELRGRTGRTAAVHRAPAPVKAPPPPPARPSTPAPPPYRPSPTALARADTRTAHNPLSSPPAQPAARHPVAQPVTSPAGAPKGVRVPPLLYVALTSLWLLAVLFVSWKMSGGLLAVGVVAYLVTRGRKHFQQGYYQGRHQ